jgi:release factor glutamine methyltransferase
MSTAESWTVGRLLQWTADYLAGHGSDSPRLDAEVLLAYAVGCQRIELYTAFDEQPADDTRSTFRDLVRRRAEGTPVAYLVGRREFYSLSFRVTPDVLIPRPETELLVMATLDLAKAEGQQRGEGRGERGEKEQRQGDKETRRQGDSVADDDSPGLSSPLSPLPSPLEIADVGTGSGVIAVCLAKHLPACRVTAIDISAAALAVAAENAKMHGVADRIEFVESDLFERVGGQGAEARKQASGSDRTVNPAFDFIVSNPPYVGQSELERLAPDVRKFEPQAALLAGPRGTEVIERLIPQAAERLRPGGHLLVEISPMIHDAVRKLLESDGRFELGPTIKDLARLPRVVQATRKVEA